MKQALCLAAPVNPYRNGVNTIPVEFFFHTQTALHDRAKCETDETLLQLISYAAIVHPDDKLFVYSRGGAGAEARLHGQLSVGVGGHIDTAPPEGDLRAHVATEAIREITEEIGVAPVGVELLGLVYDDTTEVGRVHLGVLARHKLDGGETLALEAGQVENGEFMTLEQLSEASVYDRLEPWSQRVVAFFMTRGGVLK